GRPRRRGGDARARREAVAGAGGRALLPRRGQEGTAAREGGAAGIGSVPAVRAEGGAGGTGAEDDRLAVRSTGDRRTGCRRQATGNRQRSGADRFPVTRCPYPVSR